MRACSFSPVASATAATALEHARRERGDAVGVVGLRFGNPGSRHVGVADGLDLLHLEFRGQAIEGGEDFAEKVDGPVGRQCLAERGEPDDVAEQDRRLGDLVGDGGFAAPHAVDDPLRQDVEQQGFRTLLLPLQVGDEFLLPVAQPFPLQRRADAGAQQDRVERLGEVVLGAGFDAAHRAVKLVERRDDDDRNVVGMRRRLEPAQHLEAAHFRHDEIEQNEIEFLPHRRGRARPRRLPRM